jgi:hypothetical protein
MTDPAPHDADMRWSEDLLDQVAGLLEEQLAHVRQGDFDAVGAIGERIDALVRLAANRGGLAVDSEAHAKITRLHTSLELAVRQRLSEVKESRSRLRRGSRTLEAYRRGTSG